MTTKSPTSKAQQNTAPVSSGADSFDDLDYAAPTEGVRLGETFLYRPGDAQNAKPGIFPAGHAQAGKAHCGLLPIQGQVLESVKRENDDFGEYEQIVMLLTKGGVGIDGDKILRLNKGQMITLTATGNLKDIVRYAQHPTMSAEVYIRPTGEFRKVKRGSMRVWEQVVTGMTERSLLKVPRLPQLPADDSFDTKQLGN